MVASSGSTGYTCSVRYVDQTVATQQRSLGGQGAVWRSCHDFRLVAVTARRHGAEKRSIVGRQRTHIEVTNPVRLLQDHLEHRRQIAGRGVDDLQHLGRRCLLLQRLPLFGDQARVLDRDHRLIGEGADELDLPVGEWLNPLAR